MRLMLAEPRLLRESILVISELMTEVTIKVDREKIEVVAFDPANVALVDFKLLSSAFLEYLVPEPQELAINLEHLKQILRRTKPTDSVVLSLDKDKSRLSVVLKGDTLRTFSLPLIHIEEHEQKVPDFDFCTKVSLSSQRFDDAVEDMSIIAESVALSVFPDKFVVKSESHLKDARVEIPVADDTIISLEGDALISKYSLEYLKKISKASKLSDVVTLEFGRIADYPLKIEYKLMDKLRMAFILAPRVSA